MSFQILLFYKYTTIADPEELKAKQLDLFRQLDLKGRMIIASEGINATLEGETEKTEEYIRVMARDDRFKDVHWKRSEGNGDAFPKINIKVRKEIVALGLGDHDFSPTQVSGKYITADELHDLYKSNEEFYVIDMRNDYEQRVGHFENALLMPMKNFRELPETINTISHLKHKKVITTCTGGIRCEKASGFLVQNGFTDVYQLYGGMHTYIERYPNEHFLGKLYVFDSRVIWGINTQDSKHKVISSCDLCGDKSDNYIDCANIHCKSNRHFIACKECCDKDGKAYCKVCRQKLPN